MSLSAPETAADLKPMAPPSEPGGDSSGLPADSRLLPALELAESLTARYQISALSRLLASARSVARQEEISVAVVGRFKSGKSSFLNHLLGRALLPVGVVPVTAVVTEIRCGVRLRARVLQRDGRELEIALSQIGAYVSEKENPENVRQAALIRVDLPELRPFRGLKFVDTPGLESALEHNTEAALDWLPNVGLAIVAVSVDPPLSARDIELVKSLYRFTPKVAVLLTKADLLNEAELAEVLAFVGAQLARNVPECPAVYPYSIKPGFERFRQLVEAQLLGGTLAHFAGEHDAILARKLETVLGECRGYLALGLKSAEMVEADRQALQQQISAERELAAEVKSAIHLVVQHAAEGTRAAAAGKLEARREKLQRSLSEAFETEFPKWTHSVAGMLSSFEQWLDGALRSELTALSAEERDLLIQPLHQVRQQAFHTLQQFRDRLSERTARLSGVPLPTTETEIRVEEPATPDIRVGRVFDRNWELLSPVLPVWMVRASVRRHFTRSISYLLDQNLSRLASQWEKTVTGALLCVEQEAERRMDELLGSIERLVEGQGDERAPQLRADLQQIEQARNFLAPEARH